MTVNYPAETTLPMTRQETREIITPFAFEVAPELFGTPLASPTRRGIALLIDLLLVGLLTNVSSVFWSGLIAIMFFRAGNRLKQKKRFNTLRIGLRFLTALFLFVFALGIFDEFIQDNGSEVVVSDVNGKKMTGVGAIELVALTTKHVASTSTVSEDVESGECAPAYECWSAEADDLVEGLASTSLPAKDAKGLFSILTEQASEQLSDVEISVLEKNMNEKYDQLQPANEDVAFAGSEQENKTIEPDDTDKSDKPTYSIIEWMKGIAEDLGIGFGWAAVYFTASTTWFRGRTVGKKLLGIRVIKLDNSRINLWESFERYGGYGAGLATGLLGFLQIYWDPNRQAIQDKISETLVIDTRKPKIDLELRLNGQSPESSA